MVFSGIANLAISTASVFVDPFIHAAIIWSEGWDWSDSKAGHPGEVPLASLDRQSLLDW